MKTFEDKITNGIVTLIQSIKMDKDQITLTLRHFSSQKPFNIKFNAIENYKLTSNLEENIPAQFPFEEESIIGFTYTNEGNFFRYCLHSESFEISFNSKTFEPEPIYE